MSQRRLARVLAHGLAQRLGAVDDVESRLREIDAAVSQIREQRRDDRRVLRRSLTQPKHHFSPVVVHSQRHDQVLPFALHSVDIEGTELELRQVPFQQLAHLAPRDADEMLAHRRLLDSVRRGELPHRLAVMAGREPEHELVPNGFVERLVAAEQLVAAQRLFVAIGRAHLRSSDFRLLAVDDQETALLAPAVALFVLSSLTALAGEPTHLVLHDELHQFQAGLAHQFADALLQRGGDLLEWQLQLDLSIVVLGLFAKSTDCFLAVNPVSSLHSDSPFS